MENREEEEEEEEEGNPIFLRKSVQLWLNSNKVEESTVAQVYSLTAG